MARKTLEELEIIKKKYNTDRIWSWSRVNCYVTSPYEYYLKYIKRINEDRTDCCYGVLGTICHDTLDGFYENQFELSEMSEKFNDGWLVNIEVLDLKFDRNNAEKNQKIASKYKRNLQHFFSHHIPYQYKLAIEKPVTINVNDNIFVGYIDAIYKDNENNYHIIDFKSSSIYKGETLKEHSGQLVLYAIGLHQMGIPYEKIRINFNFLKYVKVQCQQANGKYNTRDIDRCEIGEKLQTNAKMWLKKLGYEDKLLEYLDELIQTNDIKCLPQDVQDKYKIEDCIVYIDLTEDLINKWVKDITDTIKEIREKEEKYNLLNMTEDNAEEVFFDTPEQVEKESYYFSTLCGYSANLHKPYKKYLEDLEKKKSNTDIFNGVGKDLNGDSDDMSWMDEL